MPSIMTSEGFPDDTLTEFDERPDRRELSPFATYTLNASQFTIPYPEHHNLPDGVAGGNWGV